MNRNDFIKTQRGGFLGFLFPYSINRTELLIRALILGLCVGLPLRALHKTSESNVITLSLEAFALAAEVEQETPEIEMLNETILQLETIRDKINFNSALQLVSIVLSFAVYILSFWMMFIPRIRSMGHSPRLALLMVVPIVNALFAWVLIFAPPKY